MKSLNDIDGKILEIGNKDYTVNIVDGLDSDAGEWGNCQYRKNIIQIDKGLLNQPAFMLEVVIHEIQHALNERFELHKEKDEESFTNAQGVAWATVLKRNLWLAEFIHLAAKG